MVVVVLWQIGQGEGEGGGSEEASGGGELELARPSVAPISPSDDRTIREENRGRLGEGGGCEEREGHGKGGWDGRWRD